MSFAIERFGLSIRKACRLVSLWRSTRAYEPKPDPEEEKLKQRLKELAEERTSWGCPKLHAVLKREGLVLNHKRTERLYREEKLSLRGKRKKKKISQKRVPLPPVERPNERWSMDFIHRESPAIEVDTSLAGMRVVRVLDRLKETRGLPKAIVVDNGPEFSGRVLDDWAYRNGVKLDFIDPGKPVQNPSIESFNATFRKDCLNQHWFYTLEEARERIETGREDYNDFRPRESLDDLTPNRFARQFFLTQNPEDLNFQVAQQTGEVQDQLRKNRGKK